MDISSVLGLLLGTGLILLGQWMETVPEFTDYEAGSEAKKPEVPR